MLRHSLGGAGILFSLQHFIAPALDKRAKLDLRTQTKAVVTIKSRLGQIKNIRGIYPNIRD